MADKILKRVCVMYNKVSRNVYRARITFWKALSGVTGLSFCLPKPNQSADKLNVSCKFAGRILSTEVTKTNHYMYMCMGGIGLLKLPASSGSHLTMFILKSCFWWHIPGNFLESQTENSEIIDCRSKYRRKR